MGLLPDGSHINRGGGLMTGILPVYINRPFPSCCEPHYESEAKCKAFPMENEFCLHMNEN